MAKNYEVKIAVTGYDELVKLTKKLGRQFTKRLYSKEEQKDIYYKVPEGRLKLRIINNKSGSLIYYNRKENTGKRVSNYIISKTADFTELDSIMSKLYKKLVTVDKKREIYVYDNIRIHLDRVKNLGSFLEFEVIFTNFTEAKKQLNQLISYYGLNEKLFIKNSYSDILLNKKSSR